MLTESPAENGEIVDVQVLERTVARFRDEGIALPTFAQLADPATIPPAITARLAAIGPDDAHPLNLFRVHWFNDAARTGIAPVPQHVVLPREITGIDARIVVALGNRFPMIEAHKVLAAYGCLAPRLVTGAFDPTRNRAIWPSTGNYCRGGVAISRLMGCRGVAVLPEGMSKERFDWLDRWVVEPDEDVIRTPGTESNVKEIYDRCHELAADPENVIFNQFAEFGNHVAHYLATGAALGRVFDALQHDEPSLRLRAFVVRDRLGRHDRRRRLPQGAVRLADRRGRGARVPDDALQRLRRAQHPGDRRQAHPADPQRAQHRRRGRGLRPRDRPARAAVRHRGRPRASAPAARRRAPTWSRSCRRSACRASATSSRAIKTAKYYGLGADDVDRHGRDRRRRDVRQRAGARAREVLPRRLRRGRRSRGVRRAPARRDDRSPARADARGARADLQPRLLHVGRAAGHLARGLPGAPRSGLLDADPRAARPRGTSRSASSTPAPACWRRCERRRVSRLVCAGCGAEPARDDPYPFRCPNADSGDDVDHVLRRVLDFDALRFPRTARRRIRSSATGGCCTRTTPRSRAA